MIESSSSGKATMSALKALARASARIRSSNFSLDERKCWIWIDGCCSLNFLIKANASSAVVLEYQTKPFSFLLPSISRACRSAGGNFITAASAASRLCAFAGTGKLANTRQTMINNERGMSWPPIFTSIIRADRNGRESIKAESELASFGDRVNYKDP
jgi:hypothetical protein